jgi:[protein-PII] uridylyltransferase
MTAGGMTAGDRDHGLRARRTEVLGRSDLRGRALCRELAAVTDEWLREIFSSAVGAGEHTVALVAVGGYGRGELAPGSDLDLVLVHRNRQDIARVADAVWYPIWDVGIPLDHSVRTARDVGAAMDADLRVALGLLDARTIAGSEALGDEIRRAAIAKWSGRAKKWLPETAATVDARHAAAGDLAFLLEPDLKESRGGLRDLSQLTSLAQVTPVLADLVAEGRLDGPAETLTAARVELQRATGRSSNRLSLQDQDMVAAALGIDADRLAAELAWAGRTVAWASDDAWRRIRALLAGGRRNKQWATQPIEPGLGLRRGEVTLLPGADPGTDPTLALRAGAVSAEMDAAMARDMIDALATSAPAPTGVWPEDLRQALLRILGAGRPAIAAIETLDQQGVIERLLPEWGRVRNRPQRNAYHRFTVDRHLLETVANATHLVRRVARPDLLLLGALLHDIGKGLPGDHTEIGMTLVAEIAPRLGLTPADTAVLVDLVRLHLLLPEAATRWDLDDPGTIMTVAKAVGSRDTLELLSALTESDSLATGPAAWGRWKAGLVAQLVERVGRSLDGQPHPAPPEPDPAQRRLLDAGRLAVTAVGNDVVVVAPDRPGLLALVAGVLAVDGASVRAAAIRAHAGNTATGAAMALIVLELTATLDVLPDAARIERDLTRALDGSVNLEADLRERERNAPRRRGGAQRARYADEPAVVVAIDNGISGLATLIEVRAPDAVGTLWRIARAINAAGLVIIAAVASTLGAEVVDTFYVQTAAGDKLDEDRAAHQQLADDLTATLTPPP